MAGGRGKAKKKAKKRKKQGDGTTPLPLRIDLHVHLDAPAPAEVRRLPYPDEWPEPTPMARAVPGRPGTAAAEPEPDAPEVAPSAQAVGPAWPVGPHYLRWVEGKGADAWARFKLKAAEWYLGALEAAEADVGLDRYVGVEMAIDGALSCLLAGVDAAGHALLDELERFAGPSRREGHGAGGDWSGALRIAEGLGVDLACRRAVEKAFGGDDADERDGWLVDLRQLHALAVRRNVLVRRPSVDGTARNRLLDVPGVGQRPVLRHLSRARQRAETLVEAILADVESLGEQRLRPERRPGAARAQALPNLAARADVIPSHWRTTEDR